MLTFVSSLVTLLSVFGGYALEGGQLGALTHATGRDSDDRGRRSRDVYPRQQPQDHQGNDARAAASIDKERVRACSTSCCSPRRAREGTLALEADIDDPHKSPLFNQYPNIFNDHHIVEFMTGYLRIVDRRV